MAAVRSVFVQFNSNIGTFSASMREAATATAGLRAAQIQAAESSDVLWAASERVNHAVARFGPGSAEAIVARQELALATAEAVATDDALVAAEARVEGSMVASGATITRMAGLLTLALGVALYETVKVAGQFDNSMRQAAATSDFTREHFGYMSDAIVQLSMSVPVSANELAAALTVVNQAGYQGAAAIEVVKLAAEAATVGMGDTATVARTLADVMASYAIQGTDVVSVQQSLIAAWRISTTSFDSFAKGLMAVAPVAAQLHIPLSEITGAMATMTRNGMDASTAGQVLQRTLFSMEKPSTELSAAMMHLTDTQHSHGFASADEALQVLGLHGVLEGLRQQVGNNNEAFVQLIPSIRSARAFYALFANDGRDYATVMSQLSDKTKVAKDAAIAVAQAQGSFSNQLKLTRNDISAAAISLGTILMPVVQGAANAVGGMAMAFQNASPAVHTAVAAIGGIALAAGTAIMAVSLMAKGIDAAGSALVALGIEGVTAEALLGPLLLIAAPLAALGAIFALNAASTAKNTASIKEYSEAIQAEKTGTQGAAEAQVLHKLATDGLLTSLEKTKINTDLLTAAVMGGKEGIEARNTLEKQWTEQLGLTDARLKEQGVSVGDITRIHKDLRGAVYGSRNSYDDLRAVLSQYNVDTGKHISDLGKQAKETSNFRDGQKGAAREIANTNAAMQAQTSTLWNSNMAVRDEQGALVELTQGQKDLEKSLKNFSSAETIFSKAMEYAKASVAQFTSASQVATDAIKALEDAQTAANKQDYGGDKSGMTDELRKAQDAAEDQAEAGQKLTETARRQAEDRIQAAQDEVEKLQDRAREVAEQDANEQANLQNVTEAQREFYRDRTKQAQDDVRAAQKRVRDLQRSNQDEIQGVEDTVKAQDRAAQDHAKEVQRANADVTSSHETMKTKVTISLSDYMTALTKNVTETDSWHKNLDKIWERASKVVPGEADTLLKGLQSMGKDGIKVVEDLANSSDKQLKLMADDFTKLSDDATVSFANWKTALDKQIIDLDNWEKNLASLQARGETNIVAALVQMGPKAAGLAADAAKQPQKVLDETNKAMQRFTAGSMEATAQQFGQGLDLLGRIGASGGRATIKQLADAMGLTPDQVQVISDNLASQLKSIGGLSVDVTMNLLPYMSPAGANAIVGMVGPTQIQETYTAKSPKGNVTRMAQGGILFAQGGRTDSAPYGNGMDQELLRRLAKEAGGDRLVFDALSRQLSRKGGEDHSAQISQASWRIWAEPETGGEAYIPLAQDKRLQSVDILSQVAQHFGYALQKFAEGGLSEPISENPSRLPVGATVVGHNAGQSEFIRATSMQTEKIVSALESLAKTLDEKPSNQTFENHFHEKVDPLHVAREISWQSRRR